MTTERFTERARKVLELALREALSLGHNYVGTEHLLLSLARQDDGIAVRVLQAHGLTHDAVRAETVKHLGGPGRQQQQTLTPELVRQIVREELARVKP